MNERMTRKYTSRPPTEAMADMLDQGTIEWAPLPSGVPCTNKSLAGLVLRRFIEMEFDTIWRWRLTPEGAEARRG